VRQTILDVLDSISDTVAFSKAKIKLYRQDLELRESSEGLSMAILDFTRYAVGYLDRSSARELNPRHPLFSSSCLSPD
jgi:hypothetical protein